VQENTSGLQQLLTATAVSALPVGLTSSTALTAATTGMHLLIRIYNHTATGTITVAGTAPLTGGAVSETTPTIPVMESPGTYYDYVTTSVYATVTASTGISVSGLTGGSITIYGIQAASRGMPLEVKLTDKNSVYVPVAQRGDFSQSHVRALKTADNPEWEATGALWPDSASLIIPGAWSTSPTSTQLPGSAISILASTGITTGSNASAANQPTAPGMILKCVISSSPTTAATVSVTGTNLYGETITEVVVPSTKSNGTYYSQNSFASIASSGIVYGSFGAGNLVISGIFGATLSGNLANAPYSTFAIGQYDGIGSYVAPWATVESWEITGGMDKECMIALKGPCQAVLPVGVYSTTTSQIPALVNPIDEPIVGWRSLVFIDAISGTAGTTQFLDVMEWKVAGVMKTKTTHRSAFNPPATFWSALDYGRHELSCELKVYMDATAYQNEYALAFKQGKKRLVQIQLYGGPNLSAANQQGLTLTFPCEWVEDPQRVFTLNQEYVELTLKGDIYRDDALGYDFNYSWNTRFPTY
jgi:hypothetical protein